MIAFTEEDRERLERQLLECEAALESERQAHAEFRRHMLEPLKDEGRSIETLSWDELLGVAVRNANAALEAERKLAERPAGDTEDTVSRESAKLVADDAYRMKLAYERVCAELAKLKAAGDAELREWLTSDEAVDLLARQIYEYSELAEGATWPRWTRLDDDAQRGWLETAKGFLAALADSTEGRA